MSNNEKNIFLFNFGYSSEVEGNEIRINTGMSLRDYFAAKAISGIAHRNMLLNANTTVQCAALITNDANLAYLIADAMLKAREVKDE